MSVDVADVIDAAGIEAASGDVVLTICDHLEWEPLYEHLLTLQDKISTYLAFIERGQMSESYPQGVGRPIRIDVVCKHQPNLGALEFLEKAKGLVNRAGFQLSWRVPPEASK
jgi:hypothetical protein